jgi:hypothetical protein
MLLAPLLTPPVSVGGHTARSSLSRHSGALSRSGDLPFDHLAPHLFYQIGAALFAMFRNVSGSIGISLSTAAITERTQVHQAYLSQWTTPLYQPFQTLIATYEQALRAMGRSGSAVRDDAVGHIYQVFRLQAAVLAYADIFMYASIIAFIMIPLSFLVAPIKCPPKPSPHHAGVRH